MLKHEPTMSRAPARLQPGNHRDAPEFWSLSTARVYNFSAGPALYFREEVLSRAGSEILDYQGPGMSVMEMSHRSKVFRHHRQGRGRHPHPMVFPGLLRTVLLLGW